MSAMRSHPTTPEALERLGSDLAALLLACRDDRETIAELAAYANRADDAYHELALLVARLEARVAAIARILDSRTEASA